MEIGSVWRGWTVDSLLGEGSFGKVYKIWNLSGLSGGKAMETAVMIAAAVSGIYVLYYIITYRIACDHVVCYGSEK